MTVAESTGQNAATIVTTAAGAGNYIVVVGQGRLNAILLNTQAGGVITIYDNTVDSGVLIGYIADATAIGTFVAYDIPYVNGICIHQATATTTLTVVYTRG